MLSAIFSFVFSLYTPKYARAENDISKEVSPVVSSRGLLWETVTLYSPAFLQVAYRVTTGNRVKTVSFSMLRESAILSRVFIKLKPRDQEAQASGNKNHSQIARQFSTTRVARAICEWFLLPLA